MGRRICSSSHRKLPKRQLKLREIDGHLTFLSEGCDQIHSGLRYRKQEVYKRMAGVSSAELVLRSVPLRVLQQGAREPVCLGADESGHDRESCGPQSPLKALHHQLLPGHMPACLLPVSSFPSWNEASLEYVSQVIFYKGPVATSATRVETVKCTGTLSSLSRLGLWHDLVHSGCYHALLVSGFKELEFI